MQLDDCLFRIHSHFFLDGHVEHDPVIPGIDFLPGNKAVQRRILGHGSAVCCKKNLDHGQMGDITAAFCMDISVYLRHVNGVGKHGVGSVAVRHGVDTNLCHGVERAHPPPVRPVPPHAMILSVPMLFHGEAEQKHTRQGEKRRQHFLQCWDAPQKGHKHCTNCNPSQPVFFADSSGGDSGIHNCYAGIQNDTGCPLPKRKTGQKQKHFSQAPEKNRNRRTEKEFLPVEKHNRNQKQAGSCLKKDFQRIVP